MTRACDPYTATACTKMERFIGKGVYQNEELDLPIVAQNRINFLVTCIDGNRCTDKENHHNHVIEIKRWINLHKRFIKRFKK